MFTSTSAIRNGSVRATALLLLSNLSVEEIHDSASATDATVLVAKSTFGVQKSLVESSVCRATNFVSCVLSRPTFESQGHWSRPFGVVCSLLGGATTQCKGAVDKEDVQKIGMEIWNALDEYIHRSSSRRGGLLYDQDKCVGVMTKKIRARIGQGKMRAVIIVLILRMELRDSWDNCSV